MFYLEILLGLLCRCFPLSNFDSFSYFQTFLSLGVEQGLQKPAKFDINDLRLLFHCYILIPRNVRVKPHSKHSVGGGGVKNWQNSIQQLLHRRLLGSINQVASNLELRKNQQNDLLFFEIVPSHCFGASEASKIDCFKN